MNARQLARFMTMIAVAIAAPGLAAPPNVDPAGEAVDQLTGVADIRVRVVNTEGKPIAQAKVTPWALGSARGHGWWKKDQQDIGIDPQETWTDDAGIATVAYPYLDSRAEQTHTTRVSLRVEHPEYALSDGVSVDVPPDSDEPFEIELESSVPVEVRPSLDGKAIGLDDLFIQWSGGRYWEPDSAPEKSAEGTLRIQGMPPGDNSILLVRLDGGRATHFSRITDFTLVAGEPKQLDIPLEPGVRLRGMLSGNVPRPIRLGRVQARSLQPINAVRERVDWATWVPVQPDGTFVIDGWPAGEPIQIVALCDGFVAASGGPPPETKCLPDPNEVGSGRPQVFRPGVDDLIEVEMAALVRCEIGAVDEDGKPVPGLDVGASPNVFWWNAGSQGYCAQLYRREDLFRARPPGDSKWPVDEAFLHAFTARTDAEGKATLALPKGKERVYVDSEVYELPAFLGRREVDVRISPGKTTEVVLRLQPRGTDKLGEWDKLAGVVFGCSTREGRRICALPGVREQMDEFAARLRDAKSQRDPRLLSEVYAAVAAAFVGVGDLAEAAKWRQKAAEQAVKITDDDPTGARN